MPRACDPNQRFPYVLESDRSKPVDEQPKFWFRAMNGREWIQAAAIHDQLDESESGRLRLNRIYDCIRVGLVDWTGVVDRDGREEPFNPDRLDVVVGLIEARELMYAMFDESKLLAAEKKTSESPCSSTTDSSAKAAAPPDDASTLPAKPSPT
jgi:hypothetical protein